jgi:hypothetical protein
MTGRRDDYEDRLELRREFLSSGHDNAPKSRYHEALRESSESYVRDNIRGRMEQLASLGKGFFSGNIISRLESIEDCMNASLQGQRYIMANPRIRQLRRDMLCNGFYDTYDDEDPNAPTPEHHNDYRRAMNGVVVWDESGGDDVRVRHYSASDDEDSALTALQRHIIQANWGFQNVLVDEKIDPTNRTGGKIGG